MRTAPGKKKALVLDHVGNCLRFGLPDEDREWSLEGITKDHRYGSGGGKQLKRCPKCGKVHTYGPRCPVCKFVYPVSVTELKAEDGDLKKIGAHESEQMKIQRRQEIAAADTKDKLMEIADKRGHRREWVQQMIEVKKRQGTWNDK